MEYINPPAEPPANVTHHTFHSRLYGHAVGYNVYLPPGHDEGGGAFPVVYHLHGWTGNESSEIWPLAGVCAGRRAITVFVNSSPVVEDREDLPVEAMLMEELIPLIDGRYRTNAAREGRSVSGFSMGGGMAFCCAVRHSDVFAAVTAYAGTYHHYYPRGYRGVGEAPDRAAALYESMMREADAFDENNVLRLVRENAGRIRGRLRIDLRVGADDVLFCDSEIMHRYLDALRIPHAYRVYGGVAHVLEQIV